MLSDKIQEVYPLAALLLHECGQSITEEKLKNIFDHLGVEFQHKLGELFCLNNEKIEAVYSSLTQTSVSVSETKKEEDDVETEKEKPKEEAPAVAAEDTDLFDDDMFG